LALATSVSSSPPEILYHPARIAISNVFACILMGFQYLLEIMCGKPTQKLTQVGTVQGSQMLYIAKGLRTEKHRTRLPNPFAISLDFSVSVLDI